MTALLAPHDGLRRTPSRPGTPCSGPRCIAPRIP